MSDGASQSPEGSATATERMDRVLELLETRETVTVSELAESFAVSEVTVRSDLSALARQGLVARIRGGARALQSGQSEAAFDIRLRVQESAKRAIARAAAAMVGDGEAVALDSSTTAFYIALELREKRELVVVTNGLRIATALADAPGVSVIVPGGVAAQAAMSLVGDFAASVLRTTSIGKGFFGARGISSERGLMDLNPDEVRIKREMAEACEQRRRGLRPHQMAPHRPALVRLHRRDRRDRDRRRRARRAGRRVAEAEGRRDHCRSRREPPGAARPRCSPGHRSQGGGGHDRQRVMDLTGRRAASGDRDSGTDTPTNRPREASSKARAPPVSSRSAKGHHVKGRMKKQLASIGALCLLGALVVATATAAAPLKTGLKVFVIPKNLGNPYFTTSDGVKSGGALAALKALKENGSETSGTPATPASQIPAIQAAITKGANACSSRRPTPSALCPTLKQAMAKGITVVTYDSDAPACRSIFINQADSQAIGASEVDLLAKQINKTGEIAIVSAAASATNQNVWIGFMKQELKKYPKMKLVDVVYGNDDPTLRPGHAGPAAEVPRPQGHHLAHDRRHRGRRRRARYARSTAGKIKLTGLGTPNSLQQVRQGRHDRRVRAVEPGRPRLPCRLRRSQLRLRRRSRARPASPSRPASSASSRIGADHTCCSARRTCSTRRTSRSSTSRNHRVGRGVPAARAARHAPLPPGIR